MILLSFLFVNDELGGFNIKEILSAAASSEAWLSTTKRIRSQSEWALPRRLDIECHKPFAHQFYSPYRDINYLLISMAI